MTLALGCSCVEGGAVLIVDSARTVFRPDGTTEVQIVADKMTFTGDDRIVAVHSGPSPIERKALRLAEDAGSFDTAAHQIFESLSGRARGSRFDGAEAAPHFAVVAGVGVHGQRVRMTYFRTGFEPVYAPDSGAIFIAGEDGPEDALFWRGGEWLEDCYDKALRLATILMRERIDEAKQRGAPPPVAWPLHVAAIDSDHVETWTVEEEDAAG